MSLREEIKPYFDSNGLVVDRVQAGSKNGLLNLSLYHCLLVKRGESRLSDLFDFERAVRACQVEPGNFKRSPTDDDLEAGDDYKGICTAAYLLHSPIAKEIQEYGKSHFEIFNWKNPGTPFENGHINYRTFFGRDLSFIAHTYFAAGEIPPFYLQVAWSATVFTSARSNPNDQDAWKLSWCLIQAMDGKSAICRLAANNWKKRLYQNHPGGMKEVLTAYWGFEHPIAKYFI